MFWVHASNAARLEQSYRDIASSVKVPGGQNPKANIFQLVHDWLRDERKGKWVLILDNVDNAGFLLEAPSAGHNELSWWQKTGTSQLKVKLMKQKYNQSVSDTG